MGKDEKAEIRPNLLRKGKQHSSVQVDYKTTEKMNIMHQ